MNFLILVYFIQILPIFAKFGKIYKQSTLIPNFRGEFKTQNVFLQKKRITSL